eukprot:Phypoly_transcript_01397.p1 GENE.Phypoly_transcript_01397~~Phypoly_transcript_01397.p1  ORF type:complete len:783 (-),score=112.44 Phypoly_transcript_01397:102-2450(-)
MDSPVVPRDAPQQYIAGCTNDDSKRIAVLEELVATEHTYLKDLQVLIKGYLRPLKNSMILSEMDVEQLACNIDAIEALHQDIFEHLLSLVHHAREQPQPPLSTVFAVYFSGISERLRLYSTYSSEIPERILKDPLFVMFLERVRAVQGTRLHLDDYLIKPIQRICKYPLLFRELERNSTPNSEEWTMFHELVHTLDGVVQHVNEARKQFESVKRVIEVENMISDLPEPLVASGRVLVKEGMLQKQSPREGSFRQDRYCFLFRGPVRQDILVYTKMKNKKSYTFRGKLDLSSSYMKELPAPQPGFVILLANSPKTYTFFCKSMVERQTWMTELVSMVRPNKPAESFIKSGSGAFYPSPRPNSQSSLSGSPVVAPSNLGSVHIGSGKVRKSHPLVGSPPDEYSDGVDVTDGAGSDGSLYYDNTPSSPIQEGRRALDQGSSSRSRLRASNDSDKSADDDITGSPITQYGSLKRELDHLSRNGNTGTNFIRMSSGKSFSTTTEPTEPTDEQKEIVRLQSVISGLEYKLQKEVRLRIRLEKELEITQQKLLCFEAAQHNERNQQQPQEYNPQAPNNNFATTTKTQKQADLELSTKPAEFHKTQTTPLDAPTKPPELSSSSSATLPPSQSPQVSQNCTSSPATQEPLPSSSNTQSSNRASSSSMNLHLTKRGSDAIPIIPDFGEGYEWIKEGFLTKMGEVRQSWKSRLFRLAPGFLLYFKTPRDDPKKYLGVVHLTKDVTTVTRSTKKPFCVAIHTPTREWLLCALSDKEAQEWMQAISSAGAGSTVL